MATATAAHTPLHENRRAEVLRAARKVFEDKGLDGASIRLIAQAAGCTTGSIYPYFKGKEEIYSELLSESLQAYEDHLRADVAAARTPEKRFAAALMAHYDHYQDRPGDMSLALYLFNGLKPRGLTKELDARLNDQLASILSIYRDCVRDVAKCTERKAEIEVGLLYSMLFGLLVMHHTKRTRVFHVDARALLKLYIRQSIDRLTAAPR